MIPETSGATSVCVSVVLHESAIDTLEPTLNRLEVSLRHAYAAGDLARARIVLRDNASGEAYRHRLRSLFDSLAERAPTWQAWSVYLDPVNAGFGVAHNRSLLDATEPCLLILNPDVELAADAISSALRALATHPSVTALNPLCMRAEGHRDHLCKRYPAIFDLFLRGLTPAVVKARFAERLDRYEYRSEPADEGRSVELLSGACLFCRGDSFQAVGGFDARYFLYFEDFDLALRLRTLGTLRFEPAMRAVHHGGFAARKGWRHRRWFIRSAIRFFQSHGWRLL